MIDLDKLLAAWPISHSRTLRPLDTGTNNLTRLVTRPNGDYILRIYQNTVDSERIRYEHALLLRLQQTGLSFAVPNPLVAASGQTYVTTEESGHLVIAAIFPVIPGRRPDARNDAEVDACGAALGELDRALAEIDLDPALPSPPPFGAFAHIHDLIPDPITAVAHPPIAPELRDRLSALLVDLASVIPQLDARLPRQIIHGDFYPSNVLMASGRVSGILDFEFAGPGLRAMDLAVGLGAFAPTASSNGSDSRPIVERFAAGYRRWILPATAEIASLPTLLRLREATSLIHWLGRYRQGLTTEADIANRANRLLRLDADLSAHGEELVRRV
jgi:Ser/Thr protein kinase RdoA (MazF antagonist)